MATEPMATEPTLTKAGRPGSRAVRLGGVFASLKLLLLRNGLKGSLRTRVGTVVMAVGSVVGGFYTSRSFIRDANDVPLAWSRSLIPGFTMIFLAWVFGPLLLGGVDDTLDPRRLSLLPLRTVEMIRGIAIGAFIGFLPLGTIIALTGVVIGYSKSPATAAIVFIACVAQLALVFSIGRLLSALLAWASRSRRGRDLGVLIASMTAAVLWLATQSLGTLDDEQVDRVNSWLQWTPPGMLGRAIIDGQNRNYGPAVARIAFVIALVVASLVSWSKLLAAYLVVPPHIRQHDRQAHVMGKLERITGALVNRIGGPIATTVFSKELRYLSRSPGRRSAMAISMVMGAPFVVLQVLRSGGFEPGTVVYAPISLIFGLGAVNNLLGNDGPSLWLEVTSGARLRELMIGRGAGAIPYLVIPSTLTSLLLIGLSRSTYLAADVLIFVWFAWGIPLGIGSYLSVVAPFSQADDSNPFSNGRGTTGSSVMVMIVAVGGIFAAVFASAPLVAFYAWSESLGIARVFVLIPASLLYGLAFWYGGVRLATRRVDKTGMDLLGLLTPRASHT
jgi:ABC-2 type transport system permease protein